MSGCRALLGSPAAWARWTVGVVAYAAVAGALELTGRDGGGILDALLITFAVAVVLAWPAGGDDGRMTGARRIAAGLTYVALALPVRILAGASGEGFEVVGRVVAAVAILVAWGVTVSTWPTAGVWLGTVSLALAGVSLRGDHDALVTTVSAPRAFAAGVSSTAAHVALVASLGIAGASRTRLRAVLTNN